MHIEVIKRETMHSVNTVALFSRWVDDSQVRVRVRKIPATDKVIVDLFVLSPEHFEPRREEINSIAINAAISNGAITKDFCVLRDYLTSRKFHVLEGPMKVTQIREKSYAF